MDQSNRSGSIRWGLIGLLMGCLVIISNEWRDIRSLNEQVDSLQEELDGSRAATSGYIDALEQANTNIEDINGVINDAKSTAWGTYQEMGEALDGLEEVEVVDVP